MFEQLDSFLRPLREIDWSSWECRPIGLLKRRISFERRYCTIPVEAVPILDLGVDGCHYAVWLDDPRAVLESPGVVHVSPTDPYPDALHWVAPSVQAFVELIRPDDEWLLRDDPRVAREQEQAEHRRAAAITVMTADGMGVIEREASDVMEVPEDPAAINAALHDLVAKHAPHDALVLARNVIAKDGLQPPGFGVAVAAVYTALGRPELAAVARKSYETSEERWNELEAMAAAFRARREQR